MLHLPKHIGGMSRVWSKVSKSLSETLAEMTGYTAKDFRENPILMAKVEDQYEKYVDNKELLAINAWEKRTR